MSIEANGHTWWSHLRHGGLLIAPQILDEFFDPPSGERRDGAYEQLRARWLTFEASAGDRHGPDMGSRRKWVDAVLAEFLGLSNWQRGPQVDERFRALSPTGQVLRPDRVLLDEDGDAILFVVIDDADRVGIGRGRRAYARTVELLRSTGTSLGLLANGRQYRLIYVGPDYDAWAEWDAATWFDEGEAQVQLDGLKLLLARESLLEGDGGEPLLLRAIEASRNRQADLALVLGEQVRTAVEKLIGALDSEIRANEELLSLVRRNPISGDELTQAELLRALYQAATRLIMRMVVVFFGEARELLPKGDTLYHDSYSLEGLYAALTEAERHEGPDALGDRRGAWPRLLSLFRLIHEGSAHEALPVPAYGGALFQRGDFNSERQVLRALAAFESINPSDRLVLDALRLLKVGKVRVRQGRVSTWVRGPVDFSDLRTEYIGIIYEGLLDFELKRVSPREEGLVFLNVGRQPALPLARLESLSDAAIKDMFEKLSKEKVGAAPPSEEEAGEEEGEEEIGEEEEVEELEESAEEEPSEELHADAGDPVFQRALAWAERAVEASGMIRKRRGKEADVDSYQVERRAAAQRILGRVLRPDELYLIRWGGTRKGSGTFYTRPALAVPTTHRALEPLLYEQTDRARKPRAPEQILSLKIVDPAMGSGSFLVAAARYVTEALAHSLIVHDRIRGGEDETVVTLPLGHPAQGELHEELLPVRPEDDRFEELLRARLKRHVVERCIYGVDINPMAVELARLSLWVETMDRELPFEFLDHKLKVGDSLVGAWFHVAQDHPLRAWEREGGDGQKGERTKAIKEVLYEKVRPELMRRIKRQSGQLSLWEEAGESWLEHWRRLQDEFRRLHELPSADRERAYRDITDGEDYRSLKDAFNRWCAVWFWPVTAEKWLTPAEFDDPPKEARDLLDRLVEDESFFHWELEFSDVFSPAHRGFDAVLGNPPWDIQKPNSKEFFSNYDPLYRTYGKQEALRSQEQLFESDPTGRLEETWLEHRASFKARSNWVRSASDAFDAPLGRTKESRELRDEWLRHRQKRDAIAHAEHPFRYQGSADLNTYKMFLELAHHLLRDGGRLGFLVPSGLYTDKGSTDLRRLFLEKCQWEWLYGFENRRALFPIHRSYKFNPIVLERGGTTTEVQAAFMRHDLAEWESREPPTTSVNVRDIWRFAPKTASFMEFKDRLDLEIVEKIYADHPLLGDLLEELGGEYNREFDMTNDSGRFTSRKRLEKMGLLGPDEDTRDPRVRVRLREAGYLVLYEGKGFWQFNPYFAELAKFVASDKASPKSKPEYFSQLRVAFRDVSSSTNQRTFVASLLPPSVHGNKAPTLDGLSERMAARMSVLLNSVVLDYIIRMKVSTTLNLHYVETVPIVRDDSKSFDAFGYPLAYRLQAIGADFPEPARNPIVNGHERLAARLFLDALVGELYGLTPGEFAHICTRFPIFDGDAPEEYRYPALAASVYGIFRERGAEDARDHASRLARERKAAGVGAGLEEIWVPDGSWELANKGALRD